MISCSVLLWITDILTAVDLITITSTYAHCVSVETLINLDRNFAVLTALRVYAISALSLRLFFVIVLLGLPMPALSIVSVNLTTLLSYLLTMYGCST